ncbi:MAG: TrbI/VirB10 family protein [Opitutaceae bacterium]|jgi:hypothetical protein|nr:TrbI/VirB10 family protein [Opitutaceae bacterium]
MKRLAKFFKTPVGSTLAVVMFVFVGVLLVHGSNQRDRATPDITPAAESGPETEHHSITRNGQSFVVPTPEPARPEPIVSPPVQKTTTAAPEVSRPHAARQPPPEPIKPKPPPPAPPALPITLFIQTQTATEPAASSDLSKKHAPYGRLIPCETVITLESSKIETPIIALVTEDVWHDGRLIIPAGAEVHGRAAQDHARERIAASGNWIIVWRDHTENNGLELVVNGIALDRQRDDVTGEFGLRDGSAGLVGQILRTDDLAEIKLFASTFLAGMASGLQEMQTQTTAFGDTAQIPKVSAKNTALQGTANVLNTYAERIRKIIAEDGYYVRVPTGKQFYLYVTQTLDQAKATRGNLRANLWKNES